MIIDTYVVSRSGKEDSSNLITINKLYLLSMKEVYGKDGTIDILITDSASDETRKLDYYENVGVTISNNFDDVIKQFSKSNKPWSLRSDNPNSNTNFYLVAANTTNPINNNHQPSNKAVGGISPAFRIG